MTWVAAAVGVAGLAVSVGTTVSKNSKDKKAAAAAAKNRPKYEVPTEVFQNKAMYEAMANSSRVPGQSIIEDRISQNSANAISQSQKVSGSSADALSAVGAINQNNINAVSQLGVAGAQQQMASKDKLAMARSGLADYNQQAFDYNKNQPYVLKYAEDQKRRDQQYMDTQQSINSLSQIGMSAASGYQGNKKTKNSGGGDFYGF